MTTHIVMATDIPVNLTADHIQYDAANSTITAEGHVHLTQENSKGIRILDASKLIYNTKDSTLTAYSSFSDKIHYTDINQDVIEAEELSLSHDFKTGTIKTLTLLTKDKTTLHAVKGHRQNGIVSTMEMADYTPCTLCSTKKPMWQLKADKITHDKDKQTIVYTNARLEVKGVPIFYTPYFYHPDPTVKRQSGILSPEFGSNQDLGYTFGIPVYYVISDQNDITLTPVLTTKQSGIIKGEYRQRFHDGAFKVNGSYTKTNNLPKKAKQDPEAWNGPREPSADRWNVAMQSRVDINDEQRLSMDLNRASDTTYLSRYRLIRQSPFISDNKSLRSNITWQRFTDTTYMDMKSLFFQTDAPKTTPIVLPKGMYHYQTNAPHIGGDFAVEGDVLALYRDYPVPGRSGTNMYRLSNGVSWQRPLVLPYGQIITAQTKARGDVYMMRRYYTTTDTTTINQSKTLEHRHIRVFPQGSLDWQWPFQKRMSLTNWVIKPQTTLVSNPTTLNNRYIPNEDSQTFELDDTNLFAANRFDGIDRVDTGTRSITGIENELRFSKQRMVALFLGQSRRLDNQHVVRNGLGEDTNKTDMIMRIKAKPASWLSNRYRMAINPSFKTVRYSEFGTSIGKPIFKIDAAHVFLNKNATQQNNYISQLNLQVSSKFTETWSLSVGQIRNLKQKNGGTSLATFIAATYEDECFAFNMGVYRSGYHDRDLKPDTSFLLSINFKTLTNLNVLGAPTYQPSPLTAGLSQ